MILFEWILPTFLLVLFRLSSFFLTAPLFSNRIIPVQYKLGFSFFLSVLVVNVIGFNQNLSFDSQFILLIIKEVLVGIILGFVAAILLYAVQMAGSLIDIQMGFGIANVIDPMTGAQSPLMGNFKYMLAALFLLVTNGHHMMIRGILNSYFLIPLDQWAPIASGGFTQYMIQIFVKSFAISIQIAAPVVATLFLVDVALGIISKTVPQLNVFVVGIPLKILTSFIILLIVLPGFFYILQILFEEMFQSMDEMMQILVRE